MKFSKDVLTFFVLPSIFPLRHSLLLALPSIKVDQLCLCKATGIGLAHTMKCGDVKKGILLVAWLSAMASVFAVTQGPDLIDPATQPKFSTETPNALDPNFFFHPDENGKLTIKMGLATHHTGLIAANGETLLPTPIYGYGTDESSYTWPGKSIEIQRGESLEVKWVNELKGPTYLLTGKDNTALGFGDYTGESVIDSTLHWAYSLSECKFCGLEESYSCGGVDSLKDHGIPTVTHVGIAA